MIWLVLYVASIWLANWTLVTFGFVPVWPGVQAPAGVLWAGASLTLRDLLQESLGRRWTIAAILLGAALSAFVSPQLALASGAAFLLSETADMLVYVPLRRRSWWGAILASNAVGDVVDSICFLWLAFGSLDFLAGQLIGKWEVSLLTVAVLWVWRTRRTRRQEALA